MRILLTPYLFLLVEHTCRVVPFYLVIILALVLRYAFHKALIVNVEAVADAVAGLTVLVLLRVNGLHYHLAVLRRGAGEHGYAILVDVVQALLGEIV